MPVFSIIVCSASEEKSRAITAHYKRVMGAEPFELILVCSPRSLASGYNQGIADSRGEILIFCHDDIEILTADFVQILKKHLSIYDIVGVAGTTRMCHVGWLESGPPFIFGQVAHPIKGGIAVCIYGTPERVVENVQGLDGVFIATTRQVVDTIRFDASTFTGFHGYDADFTFAAHLAGFRLAVCNDISILHASGGTYGRQWASSGHRFKMKYRAKLAQWIDRKFQFARVLVKTKEEALEFMNTTYR